MPASDGFDLGLKRDGGLTHVLDKGLGPRAWEDVLETAGEYIDIVKLGWGTACVTGNLERKLEILREKPRRHRRHVLRGRLRARQARRVQALADRARPHARRDLRRDGRDPARAQARADRRLRARLHRPLRGRLEGLRGRLRAVPVGAVDQGGARRRRLEGDHRVARGRHRRHLPPERRDAHRPRRRDRALELDFHDLVWEAPTKSSQAWFIKHFGPAVNLGNIPPDEVIPLETLRLGLRGDTLKEVLLGDAEPAAPA